MTDDYRFELLDPPQPCCDDECCQLTWLWVTNPDGASGPMCAGHFLDGGTDDPESVAGRARAHEALAADIRRLRAQARRRGV